MDTCISTSNYDYLQKKKKKKVYRFKMVAILLIILSHNCTITWKLKNPFPKANFNEIWLKVADLQLKNNIWKYLLGL